MTLPDPEYRALAFEVCTAFDRAGIVAVLSGGGAATIYAPSSYQSSDLDFVADFYGVEQVGVQVVLELGFVSKGRIWEKPGVLYTLDFPKGPLGIGDEYIQKWDTLLEGDAILHIITPTDSVKDRLAAFLHWNDFSGLEQALAVAAAQAIDLQEVRRWCEAESGSAKFAQFIERLQRP